MRIGVLALQGAFAEHRQILASMGVDTFEIRCLDDWEQPKDGLILPGGESTTQLKLLIDLGLWQPVRDAIVNGLPVFGTCAGLILLAKEVDSEQRQFLSTMDIEVCRNAYGRQLGSFQQQAAMQGVGDDVTMTFIRAPYIQRVYGKAEALAEIDGHIVAARQDNQLVTAFHPELGQDTRVHQYFIDMVNTYNI